MTNIELRVRLKGENETKEIAEGRKKFIKKQAKVQGVSEAHIVRAALDTYRMSLPFVT